MRYIFLNSKHFSFIEINNAASFDSSSVFLRNNTEIGYGIIFSLKTVAVVNIMNMAIKDSRFIQFIQAANVSTFNIRNIVIDTNNIKLSVISTSETPVLNSLKITNITAINNSFKILILLNDCNFKIVIGDLYAVNNTITGRVQIIEMKIYEHPLRCYSILNWTNIYITTNQTNGYMIKVDLHFTMFFMFTNVSLSYSNSLQIQSKKQIPVINFYICKPFGKSLDEFQVDMNCPINYNPSLLREFSMYNYIELRLDCTVCDSNEYNLRGGKKIINASGIDIDLKIDDTIVTNECKNCPIGGDCTTQIKSRANFYGYLKSPTTVEFLQCPKQYCCSDKGNNCTSYNTCNNYRKGLLCGSCMDGFYINFFSNKCISNKECTILHQIIFWFTFISSAAIAGIVIKSIKNIISFVKVGVMNMVQCLKQIFRRKKIPEKESTSSIGLKYKGVEHSITSAANNLMLGIPEENCNHHSQETQTCKSDMKEDVSFSVIFNILMSFYQLKALIDIDSSDVFLKNLVIGSIFFNLDVTTENLSTICPLQSLNVMFRDFVKSYLMAVVMFTANVISIGIVLSIQQCSHFLRRKVLLLSIIYLKFSRTFSNSFNAGYKVQL